MDADAQQRLNEEHAYQAKRDGDALVRWSGGADGSDPLSPAAFALRAAVDAYLSAYSFARGFFKGLRAEPATAEARTTCERLALLIITSPLNMALCFSRLGRHAEAADEMTAVLRQLRPTGLADAAGLDAKARAQYRAKAHFRRGASRGALGQLADARDDLREAARLLPKDPAVRRALGAAEAALLQRGAGADRRLAPTAASAAAWAERVLPCHAAVELLACCLSVADAARAAAATREPRLLDEACRALFARARRAPPRADERAAHAARALVDAARWCFIAPTMGIFGDGHYSEYLGGQWPVSQRERWGIDRRQSLCSSGLLLSASGSEILGALSGTRRFARGGLHYWQVAVRFRECEWSGVEVGVCAPEPGAPTPRAPTGLVYKRAACALCRRWMCASESASGYEARAPELAEYSFANLATDDEIDFAPAASRPEFAAGYPTEYLSSAFGTSAAAMRGDAPLPRDTTACDVIGVLLDLRRDGDESVSFSRWSAELETPAQREARLGGHHPVHRMPLRVPGADFKTYEGEDLAPFVRFRSTDGARLNDPDCGDEWHGVELMAQPGVAIPACFADATATGIIQLEAGRPDISFV